MDNELSKGYFITIENYQQILGDTYNAIGFFPKFIIQYPILLPFHLPFPDGYVITYAIDDNLKLSYAFTSISKEYEVTEALNVGKKIKLPIKYSRIEMIYAIKKENVTNEQHELTVMFDELLHYLNCVITAYTFIKRDYSSFIITKEMLQTHCFVQTMNLHNLYHKDNGIFLLHMDIPYLRPELSDIEVRSISSLAYNVNKKANILFTSTEFMYYAQRYCVKGFFRESVIFCQTSVESLLNMILIELCKFEMINQEEIDKIFEYGFIRRIKREYSIRLGGNWNVEDVASPIGKWFSNTYQLRNRIVHGGFMPSHLEADLSINSTLEFIHYVLGLLQTKKHQSLYDMIMESWLTQTL